MQDKNTQEWDNLEDFENHETSKEIPLGWLILFIGLIVFGIYYMYSYVPKFSGWTQASQYEQSLKQ